jgi:uncharacterized protein GlcG (DUF336 family)
MRFFTALLALVSVLALPSSSAAQQRALDAKTAMQIIEGCASHARAKNQSHAIAVYDDGGHPVAVLRMDGNPPGVTAFAMQKAEAVAHWRFSTANMANAVKVTPGFANAPMVVTVPGGVPVFASDGRFIGAVGVSGEAAQDDAACAEAGVKAAGLSSSRR